MSRLWLAVVLAGCATAGQSPGDGPHPTGDGPPSGRDGDTMRDAPPGSCATPATGMVASWSFIGEPGSQLMTAASTMAAGITAGPVSRSSGLTVASGVGSINSSNWATGTALDVGKYYTLSVTPPAGCTLALTSLATDTKTSGTGPTQAAVGTSADSFAATSPVTLNATGTATLAVTGATDMVELRVYGWAATGSGGTFRIQNTLTLTGSLQ